MRRLLAVGVVFLLMAASAAAGYLIGDDSDQVEDCQHLVRTFAELDRSAGSGTDLGLYGVAVGDSGDNNCFGDG